MRFRLPWNGSSYAKLDYYDRSLLTDAVTRSLLLKHREKGTTNGGSRILSILLPPVGIQANGIVIVLQSVLGLSQISEGKRSIQVGDSVFRLETDGLIVVLDGLFKLAKAYPLLL